VIGSEAHNSRLDGVRALAAVGIVLTHVGFVSGASGKDSIFGGVLWHLDFSVAIFFVLSGLLLFRKFADRWQQQLSAPLMSVFWLRRSLRILPAYWIAFVVTYLLLSPDRFDAGDFLSNLLLVQMYNGHALIASWQQMWSLAVEVGFYFLLPLICLAARRTLHAVEPLKAMTSLLTTLYLAAIAANLAARSIDGNASAALLWVPSYLDWFALGMLIALADLCGGNNIRLLTLVREWSRQPIPCLITSLLLFAVSLLPVTGPQTFETLSTWPWNLKHQLYGLAAFFLVLPFAVGGNRGVDLIAGNPFVRWLGKISYGVFLWHVGLLLAIQKAMGWPVLEGHFWELLLLTLISSIALAAASWYLLEQPLQTRFRRTIREEKVEQRQG
jgi:peptidoglycan/LPS O-acetylase OafA/YrhL